MHPDTTWSMLLKLLLSGALGATVGVERQIRHRAAGIRTSMFICMGSCLFTTLSGAIAQACGDTGTTRIAANLVQGVGFLGAGAILRDKGNVVGLTTASVIFVMAAVGMGVGGGFYALSSMAALLVLLGLITLGWFEELVGLKTRLLVFRVSTQNLEATTKHLHECLDRLKLHMQRFQVLRLGDEFTIEFEADVSSSQQHAIVTALSDAHDHCEVVARDESAAQ
jgi:putative Mg2+ transporter-C (MgtC) family protein